MQSRFPGGQPQFPLPAVGLLVAVVAAVGLVVAVVGGFAVVFVGLPVGRGPTATG